MSKVSITRSLLDDLAMSISAKSGEAVPLTLTEMKDAVDSIQGGGTTIDPLSVTSNGTYTAQSGHAYSPVTVSVPTPTPSLQTKTKTYTPTETAQTESVSADSGYDGLDTVSISVGAIDSTYVGTGVTRRSSTDLTASGATVTVPSGYYSAQASKAVASGTAGTPTATKGTVSNHQVSVTPSVTNTTGYITGSTKTGTAVTVSASELVSGSETKTANGTYDVTNLAELVVNVPSSGGSSWTHIAHTTLTVNTTSTSAASAGTLSCGTSIVDKDKIIYVRVRDTEGARAGYHAGSDAYFMNYNKANGSTSAFAVPAVLCYRYTTSSAWAGTAGQYGVYGYSISNTGVLTVRRRYNSNYSLTINSTYDVDVFTLDYPSGYPSVFDS